MNICFLHTLFLEKGTISTDSRKIKKGSLFFALKGAQFNGNLFALEALQKGASYAIVDEEIREQDSRLIRVKNVLETLQELSCVSPSKIEHNAYCPYG